MLTKLFRRIRLRIVILLSIACMVVSAGWALLFDFHGWHLLVDIPLLLFVAYQYYSGIRMRAAAQHRQKRTEERIRHMAYYDDLTGLPNRRQFREQLTVQLAKPEAREEGLTVYYMDIDRFRLINESLGHDYGDILLLHVAERLTRIVGPNDLAARLDGDEFALFFRGTRTAEAAYEIASGIMEVLKPPFVVQEYRIHITASIGLASYDGAAASAEELMRGADAALSRAKENGKNTYLLFTDSMSVRTLERLKLEQDLREAIANRQFVLYYQPQIDISTDRIIGFEALLRWMHPEKGMLSPSLFIPIAEENGMIAAIGEWVLREACRQNKVWQDAGYDPVPIAVNLSTRQFLQPGLSDKIRAILHETGLEPQYLGLEITESVMMNIEQASECLFEMKRLGVHISIDDFGTGYCSLSYLKKLPIDKLKIDRSFVGDVLDDPNDAAIVSTIIAMAHHLNLKVIAEGVETDEQKKYLLQHSCSEVQGYLYSPPISASGVESLWQGMTWQAADGSAG